MSTVKVNAAQIGQSITTTNNFTLYQPATPDGTVRLGNGNAGSVTDIVTLTSSGNVGIGTSSPSTPLDVASSNSGITLTNTAVSNKKWRVGGNAAGSFLITESGVADRLWLDTSGNLGLGVTPTSGARTPSLQVGGGGTFRSENYNSSTNHQIKIIGNGYENSGTGYVYLASANASMYNQIAGAHTWHTAPSGTAGNAISFTQAMTLDASGNLGVGVTSPGVKADINGGIRSQGWGGSSAAGNYFFGAGATPAQIYGDSSLMAMYTNGSERMRIDSSGNVQLSTASTSILNSSGRKILNQTGSVLQVVHSATTTIVSSTSSTRADTTLSASITPSSTSSKILVIVNHVDNQINGGGTGMGLWLMRNAVDLAQAEPFMGYSSADPVYPGGTGISYLDSPATTSAVTYKTQFNRSTGAGTVRVQGNGGRSTITLLEISA